jgi:hypothetical protein
MHGCTSSGVLRNVAHHVSVIQEMGDGIQIWYKSQAYAHGSTLPRTHKTVSTLSQEVFAMGQIFFLHIKEGVWEEYHRIQCTHGVIFVLTDRVVP